VTDISALVFGIKAAIVLAFSTEREGVLDFFQIARAKPAAKALRQLSNLTSTDGPAMRHRNASPHDNRRLRQREGPDGQGVDVVIHESKARRTQGGRDIKPE